MRFPAMICLLCLSACGSSPPPQQPANLALAENAAAPDDMMVDNAAADAAFANAPAVDAPMEAAPAGLATDPRVCTDYVGRRAYEGGTGLAVTDAEMAACPADLRDAARAAREASLAFAPDALAVAQHYDRYEGAGRALDDAARRERDAMELRRSITQQRRNLAWNALRAALDRHGYNAAAH